MVEISYNIQSDNGSLTDEHALRQWSDRYRRALEDLKDLRVASRLGNMLAAAGLTEVESKMIQLPLSDWPTGRLCLIFRIRFIIQPWDSELTL